MGRVVLVCRLAARDLRRRRTEAVLLLLAIMAATTTLTLGLVLHDAASDPYQSTREATDGPDVVASVAPYSSELPDDPGKRPDGDQTVTLGDADQPAELSGLDELASAPGVDDHSGPFPVTSAELQVSGQTSDVQAMGRDAALAPVDRPELIQGSWVSDGGVVLEAAFANALDLAVGDSVTLDGRSFGVVGVAVTAAMPPYPEGSCLVAPGCLSGPIPDELADVDQPAGLVHDPGLVWLTEADVWSLTTDSDALSYVMNLKLADPDSAQAFVDAHPATSPGAPRLQPWEGILEEATQQARGAQQVLTTGASLLGLVGVASVAVLVGGRMAAQTRRVGLLKAVGGTPSLIAAVLLAEHVLVAIIAATGGLAVGSLAAPLLTESSAGLIGNAGTPAITFSTVALVTAVALGVVVVATLVPAVRAARTGTVNALADAAHPPRRTGWLIAVSARLPVPLLLALRVAARRPRRVVLGVVSIAITVSGIVVGLTANGLRTTQRQAGQLDDGQAEMLGEVLLVVMVILLCLAAINAVFITWATVLDNRHSAALARALGASPRDVRVAVAAAQVLPALAGAVLGVSPGAFAVLAALNAINDNNNGQYPALWQLIAVVAGTVLIVAALTAVPGRTGSRRPVTETLQAELA